MKYIFGLTSLIFLVSSLNAQTIRVKFRVTPFQGTVITIDGEEYNGPRDDYFAMGFNDRKGITEHVVEISNKEYESQTFVFDASSERTQSIEVKLLRKIRKFTLKSEPVLAFEKVVSGIEYNTSIGAEYRWKYDMKEEMNLGEKANNIADMLTKSGLGATSKQEDVEDLFGEAVKPKEKKPDILIAGKVLDFKLSKTTSSGFFSYSAPVYTAKASINWQFYDRHSNTVIFKSTTESTYSFESSSSSTTLSEFFNSITNNFFELLNSDPQFKEVIENYEIKVKAPSENEGSTGISAEDKAYEIVTFIPQVKLEHIEDFSDLVKKAMKASVTVINNDESYGSGVIISKDGYIITNHHVVDTAKTLDVKFSNGMILNGIVLGSSEKYDLALIKVNVAGLSPLPISMKSNEIEQGDEVFVVGSPGDAELAQSVTKGIISGKRVLEDVKTFQTDAKVSPGNSGSPLITSKGEIIGIINMKLVGEGIEGISFAIDSKYIFNVLGVSYD